MTELKAIIRNETGVHARPAALIVQKASLFKSKIMIKYGERTVDAKSILWIMSLGLIKGSEIVISANGVDEVEAAEALKNLIDSKFSSD